MNADQFQELYKMLRGSRAALLVLDAKALFLEKKHVQAEQLLKEARELFAESRFRTLKQSPEQQLDPKARDADRQLKKLQRKQDKTIEALAAFDEILPQLERLVERDQRRGELQETSAAAPPASSEAPAVEEDSLASRSAGEELDEVARSGDVTEALIQELREAKHDQLLDVINQYFGFREVQSEGELHGDALYYIQTEKAALLVHTPSAEEMTDAVQLTSVIDQRPIKPFSRNAFLKLGRDRKMVLLTRRTGEEEAVDQEVTPPVSDEAESAEAESNEADNGTPSPTETKVLDQGAFSQLLTSAQRCGLVPDADQVGYVRDREFRLGKYDLAFQNIDMMFARFMASSGQHAQRLSREDADIASGRIKISPKDLQAKRARDRIQTQEIERARRRFQVVLEGLRVLMNRGS